MRKKDKAGADVKAGIMTGALFLQGVFEFPIPVPRHAHGRGFAFIIPLAAGFRCSRPFCLKTP